MRVVFIRHLNDFKEFIFEVPAHVFLTKNDLVVVDTYKGLALGTTSSNIEIISEAVLARLGAYLPLKTVICKVTQELKDIVEKAKINNLSELPF